jgi:hypothetical protein
MVQPRCNVKPYFHKRGINSGFQEVVFRPFKAEIRVRFPLALPNIASQALSFLFAPERNRDDCNLPHTRLICLRAFEELP